MNFELIRPLLNIFRGFISCYKIVLSTGTKLLSKLHSAIYWMRLLKGSFWQPYSRGDQRQDIQDDKRKYFVSVSCSRTFPRRQPVAAGEEERGLCCELLVQKVPRSFFDTAEDFYLVFPLRTTATYCALQKISGNEIAKPSWYNIDLSVHWKIYPN